MKNHFIFSYAGNKRNEVENIYNTTKKIYDYDNVDVIIEPFCGSCAYSYYLSTLYPKKYKYILNDNNEKLFNIFKLIITEEANIINFNINTIIHKFNQYTDDIERKKFYLSIKDKDDVYSYLFINKYYNLRQGLYPQIVRTKQLTLFKIQDIPFYNFIKNENVEFKNVDATELVKQHKDDDKTLIFLDPPYIVACNSFYEDTMMTIYEYMYKNDINLWLSNIVLCLENIWIIRMLFSKNTISDEYTKQYQMSKNKTTHIVITK